MKRTFFLLFALIQFSSYAQIDSNVESIFSTTGDTILIKNRSYSGRSSIVIRRKYLNNKTKLISSYVDSFEKIMKTLPDTLTKYKLNSNGFKIQDFSKFEFSINIKQINYHVKDTAFLFDGHPIIYKANLSVSLLYKGKIISSRNYSTDYASDNGPKIEVKDVLDLTIWKMKDRENYFLEIGYLNNNIERYSEDGNVQWDLIFQ